MDGFYLTLAYIYAGLLGLCVGSFLNVVIYRLPNNMSLAFPPSHCTQCGYRLKWYDNIPVLSYLLLGGKCRSCGTKISLRYTVVEIANTVLWLACVGLFWEKSIPLACIYMAVCSLFLCVFFIDLEHKIIFDRFQILIGLLGLAVSFLDPDFGLLSHFLGCAAGFLLLFLLAWLFEKICRVEALGGGDIKLVGVCGLLVGAEKLLLALIVASLSACALMLFLKGRRSSSPEVDGQQTNEMPENAFPFAPFLTAGFTVAILFGSEIIAWYLSILGM